MTIMEQPCVWKTTFKKSFKHLLSAVGLSFLSSSKAKMINYDKDIQNLKKELKDQRKDEKNEESQKDMVLFSFILLLLRPL